MRGTARHGSNATSPFRSATTAPATQASTLPWVGTTSRDGDYLDATHFSYEDHAKDPTYYADEFALLKNGSVTADGVGVVTAMRAKYAAGILAPYGWCGQAGTPTALRWANGTKRALGQGVAFDVDDDGDVVGDDRGASTENINGTITGSPDCRDDGRPTLWRNGRTIPLAPFRGSALAIRGGVIVGTDGFNGFLVDHLPAQPRLRYLTDLVPKQWMISSAFAIARDGRILATGASSSGAPSLLVLTPVH